MINSLSHLVLRSRLACAAMSLLALAMAAFAGWYAHRESARWPKVPASSSLAEAVNALGGAEHFVRIEDARWHCARAVQPTRDQLFIPVTGDVDSLLVLASFDESVTCDAAVDTRPITGVLRVLERKSAKARARIVDPALDLAPGRAWEAPVYELCTHCGPSQVKPALILCAVFTVIGLGLYPLTRLQRVAVERERAKPVGTGDAVATGLFLAALGVAGVFLGRDLYVGPLPLQWIAAAEAAFGLWIMLFPSHPRVRAIMEQLKRDATDAVDAGKSDRREP